MALSSSMTSVLIFVRFGFGSSGIPHPSRSVRSRARTLRNEDRSQRNTPTRSARWIFEGITPPLTSRSTPPRMLDVHSSSTVRDKQAEVALRRGRLRHPRSPSFAPNRGIPAPRGLAGASFVMELGQMGDALACLTAEARAAVEEEEVLLASVRTALAEAWKRAAQRTRGRRADSENPLRSLRDEAATASEAD